MKNRLGPGFLVTAAFIGPGTIVTCAISGLQFGSSLLWALLLGLLITFLFQEMAARLSLSQSTGLSESIIKTTSNDTLKYAFRILILLSIFLGNAAYESGNLIGASIGIDQLLGISDQSYSSLIIAGFVLILLLAGGYKFIERMMIFMVFLMGVSFVVLLVVSDSLSCPSNMKGIQFDPSTLFSSLALIGTTVVPYNLFLHSKSIQSKWGSKADLKTVRIDLLISIIIGGLISSSILLVFASTSQGLISIDNLSDMTIGLENVFGYWAKYLVSVGIFCAGFTSSLTAPLAAAYALTGLFNLDERQKETFEKGIIIAVLLTGVIVGYLGIKPLFIIQLAQFANGLLLPIIAILLIFTLNRLKDTSYKNGIITNVFSVFIVLFLLILGVRSILFSIGVW